MTRSAPVARLRHVLMVLPSGIEATATLPLSATNPASSAPRRHDQLALFRFPPIPCPLFAPDPRPLARAAVRCDPVTVTALARFIQGSIHVCAARNTLGFRICG